MLAFIIALSIIVAVHEYGHYIVGRWSGIHAEVFSIGFGPVLFRASTGAAPLADRGLPFGGYVKFLGDADAASGKDGEAIDALDAPRNGAAPCMARRSGRARPPWPRAHLQLHPVDPDLRVVLCFRAARHRASLIGRCAHPAAGEDSDAPRPAI
jgi:membrane-associated protease RseP (regulator of RpoE activity)